MIAFYGCNIRMCMLLWQQSCLCSKLYNTLNRPCLGNYYCRLVFQCSLGSWFHKVHTFCYGIDSLHIHLKINQIIVFIAHLKTMSTSDANYVSSYRSMKQLSKFTSRTFERKIQIYSYSYKQTITVMHFTCL